MAKSFQFFFLFFKNLELHKAQFEIVQKMKQVMSQKN